MNEIDALAPPATAAGDKLPGPPQLRSEDLSAWLDLTCRSIPGVSASVIVIASEAAQTFELTTAWPSVPAGLALVGLAERCLTLQQALAETKEGLATAALPLSAHGRRTGVLVLQASAAVQDTAALATALAAAAAYLHRILLGHEGELATPQQEALAMQGTLLRQVCRPQGLPATAAETANWLAGRFGCTRVGLGLVRRGAVRLEAVSHTAWFDRRTREIDALENAMEEALNQRRSVVLPPLEGGAIDIAHRDAAGIHAACSVVLPGADGLGSGVLYLERTAERPFTAPEVHTLEELARLAGPVLETRELAHRWIGGRSYGAWHGVRERLRDPRRPALRIGLGAAVLALAALLLVDTTWRVGAEAAIEGAQQRVIPAPFEGFIASAPVRAGMTVKGGALLAELDTRQIRLDLQRWSAEEAQRRSQYHDALARHDQALAAVSAAQMEQAQAQRALAEDQLARASMRAPWDAIVVSGDLTQQIGGPVEQGKPLFELAPLDAYRVVVKVEDRDIRAVRVGQRGRLVLSGLAGDKLGFVVKNISVPEARDGRNTFRVEAQLDRADRSLRPGMQGVAKIEVGQRSVLWVWTHTAWHWLGLQLWKWLP